MKSKIFLAAWILGALTFSYYSFSQAIDYIVGTEEYAIFYAKQACKQSQDLKEDISVCEFLTYDKIQVCSGLASDLETYKHCLKAKG